MIGRFLSRSAPLPTSFPLRQLESYCPRTFSAGLQQLLDDPAGELSLPIEDLIAVASPHHLVEHIAEAFDAQRPRAVEALANAGGYLGGGSPWVFWAGVLGHNAKKWTHANLRNGAISLMDSFIIARATVGLSEEERQILGEAAELTIAKAYTPNQWSRHLAMTIWCEGRCRIRPSDAAAGATRLMEVQNLGG